MKYIKQIDSIRAIAVILVVISHWIPLNNILNIIPNGEIGVDIFFVVSGFLITKILFDCRNKADSMHSSKYAQIKTFYARRTLRIFPIYYITIFLLLKFQRSTGTDIATSFPYFFTYTSNFYFFKIQKWEFLLSHFWSLAVEEQFYLIWPWIILFAKRKYLLYIIIGFISIGISGQILMTSIKMSNILTFNCFDSFGLGALLSWQLTYCVDKNRIFYKYLSILALISLLMFCFAMNGAVCKYIPLRTLISIISVWVITYLILKQDDIKFKFLFNNRILIFLGKISYGMYLYHNILPRTLNLKFINIYINPLLPDLITKRFWGLLFLFENIILLVIVSWGSYQLIEKKFLNLKKYFRY